MSETSQKIDEDKLAQITPGDEDETVEAEDEDEMGEPEEFDDEDEDCEDDDENDNDECENDCGGARIEMAREKVKDKWVYHWMMYAKNGKMVATNPESFGRLNDMKKTIASIRETIADAPFVRLY